MVLYSSFHYQVLPPSLLPLICLGFSMGRKGGSFREVVQSPRQLSHVQAVPVPPENVPRGVVRCLSVQNSCLCACRYLCVINKGVAELMN